MIKSKQVKRMPAVKKTITLPGKMDIKIETLMERLDLGYSRVVQQVLEKGFTDYKFDCVKSAQLPVNEIDPFLLRERASKEMGCTCDSCLNIMREEILLNESQS